MVMMTIRTSLAHVGNQSFIKCATPHWRAGRPIDLRLGTVKNEPVLEIDSYFTQLCL